MRRPSVTGAQTPGSLRSPARSGRSAPAATGTWFLRRAATRWPAVVAVIAAFPVGLAAADPVFNSGDLLVWGIAAMFAFGVSR